MIRSYVAEYWSIDGKTLLGGVFRSRSSRCQRRKDAQNLLDTAIELNGKHRTAGEVVGSTGYPELFVHCGDITTCIGAKCPACRKILTIEDAKVAEVQHD
jgi:hypothetical protein